MDGLLFADSTESCVERRVLTVQRLADLDLALADTILLGDLVRRELFAPARKCLGDDHVATPAMRGGGAIEKSISLELMFVCNINQQEHDDELERALLDHFISVTGFSRPLCQTPTVVQELGFPRSLDQDLLFLDVSALCGTMATGLPPSSSLA